MKIALAETNIVWEEKEKNKKDCIQWIKEATKQKASLLLFPEMTLTGFSMNINTISENKGDFNTIGFFIEEAKKNHISIGFGMVISDGNQSYNKYYIVNESGSIIFDYSKIHPFSFGEESRYYKSGDRLDYCSIDDIQISGVICYDLRFPELFQKASKNSHFIVVPANWPASRKDHWITLLKARAIENQCYIAGVNRIGEGNGIDYSGDSVVINPYGECVSVLIKSYKESSFKEDRNNKTNGPMGNLYIAEIDREVVKEYRRIFTVKADRKEELYADLNEKKAK